MRIRFTAPRGKRGRFRYTDSLHAALVNAWTACGARATDVIGVDSGTWSFGAVGTATARGFTLKSVVVGAEGARLEPLLGQLIPEAIRKTSTNGDILDLSGWNRAIDELPVACQAQETAVLAALMLSPLAISVRGEKGRWHDDLTKIGTDLDEAVSFRLSRLTGRDIALELKPDKLYLRANPTHSNLVRTRAVYAGKAAFVIGTMCPLSIEGRLEDLRSAWALGIGEKNRYGFGCVGSIAHAEAGT